MGQGLQEGTLSAMSQIDAVVADLQSFAAGRAVRTQLIGDRPARLSRVIRGSVEQVWRAHHEPELLRRWQLGPEGWTMPDCEVGFAAGETYPDCSLRQTILATGMADGMEASYSRLESEVLSA